MEKVKFEQIHKDRKASFHYGNTLQPFREEISLHFHPEMEITYIFKGSGYRMTGDYLEAFNEGELILTPSNLPHCWIYTPESCAPDSQRGCIYVQFLPGLLQDGLSQFPEWEYASHRLLNIKQAVKIIGTTAETAIALLHEMNGQDAFEKIIIFIRLIQLIGISSDFLPVGMPVNTFNHITKNMKRMQTIYKYVLEHYKNKITLAEISAAVNMTPTAFCTFFKAETGKTFNTFLNEYRIEIVCTRLKNQPEDEINHIAWQCGFNDVPYFNRAFKKKMNRTPGDWRKG